LVAVEAGWRSELRRNRGLIGILLLLLGGSFYGPLKVRRPRKRTPPCSGT
jgi:hypothetical protein